MRGRDVEEAWGGFIITFGPEEGGEEEEEGPVC